MRGYVDKGNMNSALDSRLIVDLYNTYKPDMSSLHRFQRVKNRIGSMYHEEERRILFLLVRHFRPKVVVEFSPNKGWSTLHLAHALEINGAGHIYSFELDPANIAAAQQTLSAYGLAHRVTFHVGDVRKTLPPVLPTLRRPIDFLFVDSHHGHDFARWWLDGILPAVRPGALVHVHDVEYSHQFGWGALTQTHQGKGIYGPPVRKFIRVRSWQRSLQRARWFHVAPRWLQDTLVPRHLRDVMDRPHYYPGNSIADINASSGPGEALAVKAYLDAHPQTSWLSVMALIEDPEYRAAVAPYGGGELIPWPDAWGYQRSPSLYFLKDG